LSDLLIKISDASYLGIALIGFTAGLLGSLHCIGMCGPFATSCSKNKDQTIFYHLGKAISYGALGLLAGTIGATFSNFLENPWLKVIPAFLLGLFFIFLGLNSIIKHKKIKFQAPIFLGNFLNSLIGKSYTLEVGIRRSFLVGVLTSLLPCGLLYTTLLAFATFQNPLYGLIGMFSFSLGTAPALLIAPQFILKIFKPIRVHWSLASSLALVSLGIATITLRMVMTYGQANCH